MAEDDDDAQKTEDPSQKRLEDAFKKGQGVNSREVTNFLLILVLSVTISWMIPGIMSKSSINLSNFIEHAHDIEVEQENLGKIMIRAFGFNFMLILGPMLLIIIAIIFSSFMQNQGRFMLSEEVIKFDLSRISPLKGLGRLFSKNSLVEFLKSVAKILVVSTVCYLSVVSEINKIRNIHEQSIAAIMALLLKLVADMMLAVCVILAIIAALDYLYQYFEFMKSMRMSKFEIKEEYKQTEGNPKIKAKLRRIRMERARKRMMAAVPKADVVIINPTHFSVALQYDEDTMNAPTVIAKGMDEIALKIREIAKEHKIPLVENAPLARTLYKEVEIDKEINLEHYKAVAEIISYIYKLKNKKG
jgi:flagellar biosynthetic protein FlhB